MTTQRTARVRIIATASADWTEMVEIPDHVHWRGDGARRLVADVFDLLVRQGRP